MQWTSGVLAAAVLVVGLWPSPDGGDLEALRAEVTLTEEAFARTMAERDHDGFRTFLSDEAVFLVGMDVLRGQEQVAAAWEPLFAASDPPFSWAPERVEVLASGSLALSTGPVRDPTGAKTGTFTSVWRKDEGGRWRIVFDKGETAAPVAPAEAPPSSGELPPELARVLRDYEQAWRDHDAAGLAALFTEDGFVLSGGHPPVRGRSAIEERYAGSGGPLALRALHVEVQGDLAVIIGGYGPAVGEPDSGKFTLTLRRTAAGRWEILSDMDNGNAP